MLRWILFVHLHLPPSKSLSCHFPRRTCELMHNFIFWPCVGTEGHIANKVGSLTITLKVTKQGQELADVFEEDGEGAG